MPGYGYARGGAESVEAFEQLTQAYFDPSTREQRRIAGVLHLVDSRHPDLPQDAPATTGCSRRRLPVAIVATKIDKLNRSEQAKTLRALKKTYDSPVLPVSAFEGDGLDEIWKTSASVGREDHRSVADSSCQLDFAHALSPIRPAGWQVSEIGYGMWGMGGWTGSDDEESRPIARSRGRARLQLLRHRVRLRHGPQREAARRGAEAARGTKLYIATKVPPKNLKWPGRADTPIADVFPPEHIIEMTEKSLANLGVDQRRSAAASRVERRVGGRRRMAARGGGPEAAEARRAFGISVNRWEPANVIKALRTGLVDAVQVVYNVFDQNPEDELFPVCRELDVAVIARVPFDEGSLTGTLSKDSRWPEGDWRNIYFTPENLAETLARVERLEEARARRHGPAGDGAAIHPRRARRVDGHSGHAEDAARGAEYRRQRRQPAGCQALRHPARAPVGPHVDY